MKINKNNNQLSATGKNNFISVTISISLISFGLGIYTFSSKIIGGTIILVSAFLIFNVLSQIFTKIIMHPNKLEVNTLFGNRVFLKESMNKVTWEKGGGVSIQLTDSNWINIPDLGNSQSVCNSIRTWLKSSEQ